MPDAVQHAFDVLGVDSPSSAHAEQPRGVAHRRSAPTPNAWTNWSFINLLTLVMLSPEFNLA